MWFAEAGREGVRRGAGGAAPRGRPGPAPAGRGPYENLTPSVQHLEGALEAIFESPRLVSVLRSRWLDMAMSRLLLLVAN